MVCPKCRSRAVGRIGPNQYYCWDCSIEFISGRDGFRMYRLEPDGTPVLDSPDSAASGDTLEGTGANVSPAGAGGPPAPASGDLHAEQDKNPR